MTSSVLVLAVLAAMAAGSAWAPAAPIAFVLVLFIGLFAARRARTSPPATQAAPVATVTTSRTERRLARAHAVAAPPEPTRHASTGATPFRLSGAGRVGVVGESHYQPALRKAAAGRSSTGYAAAIPATASLVPEPHNKYDSNAVRVDIDGRPVGYLSRDIAEAYQEPLLAFAQEGMYGWCEARITGGGDRHYGVFLLLAGPDDLIPITPPDGMTLLDGESVVTVTREEHHQDVLANIGRSRRPDDDGHLFASLDVCAAVGGKHAGSPVVEVRLEGQRVGELTRKMSERYMGAVTGVLASGSTPVGLATLEATARGWQVELLLPRVD